jgi:hypothetical protein
MITGVAPVLLAIDTDGLIDYLRDQPQAVAFWRAPSSLWPHR